MKFLFEAEDSIVGIIVGILLIGLSGMFFTLPDFLQNSLVLGIIFVVSLVFTLLDVKHTISDLRGHKLLLLALFLNNVIDFAIELALAASMFGFQVPYISATLDPYLADTTILLYIGIFFIASSIFWLVDLWRTN